jgi:hypothetical protein
MNILNQIWRKWKQVGQFIGDWVARILLTIFYFSIFLPFGLVVRLLGDPLEIRQSQPRWLTRITRDTKIEKARRMF